MFAVQDPCMKSSRCAVVKDVVEEVALFLQGGVLVVNTVIVVGAVRDGRGGEIGQIKHAGRAWVCVHAVNDLVHTEGACAARAKERNES